MNMNKLNPLKLLWLKEAWEQFRARHPKLPAFAEAVMRDGVRENTVIEINVTSPEGKTYSANLRITAEDMQLLEELKKLASETQR